jgi:hypothetical protein
VILLFGSSIGNVFAFWKARDCVFFFGFCFVVMANLGYVVVVLMNNMKFVVVVVVMMMKKNMKLGVDMRF